MSESPGKMYALAIVLTLLATGATCLRYYARYLKKAGYSWDDYMILPALLFTFATAILMIVGAANGDLGRHTGIDSEDWPIFTHRTAVLLQIGYGVQLTQVLTLGSTKLAVLLFYKRIFQGTLINAAVWTNVGIVSIWIVAFFFSNLLQCWPISVNWAEFGAPLGTCVDTTRMYLAEAYSDVFTDLLILSLPIPCIWAMKMPARHKIAVSGIFLLGALTVCAGIAKIVIFNEIAIATENNSPDFSIIITPSVYWPMVESSLGIVGACLPLLRPLFSRGPSQAKGFGQVRNLRSIKLDSTNGSNAELKPWGSDSEQSGSRASQSERNGSIQTVSEVSISKLVPSALPPMKGSPLKGPNAVFEEQRPKTRRGGDDIL